MEEFLSNWGYLALAWYSFGGGMLGLAIASVFSVDNVLNIYTVILVAIIFNFIGDQFLFLLARNNKEYAKKMMEKHKRKIAYSHLIMRKYGYLVIFIQKYLYGVKTLVPLAMGLTKYDTKKFLFFNLFASIIWGILIGSISYILGDTVINSLENNKSVAIGVGIGVILIILFILNRIQKK